MTTSTYKGYTIVEGTSEGVTRYHVGGEGFSPNGYATIGNARGAITKKINADYELKLATPAPPRSRALDSYKADHAALHAPSEALTGTLSARFDSLAVGDTFHDDALPGHLMTKVSSENATSGETTCGTRLDYSASEQIFPHDVKPGVVPSRNKREGHYVGHYGRAVRDSHKTGVASVKAYVVLVKRGDI